MSLSTCTFVLTNTVVNIIYFPIMFPLFSNVTISNKINLTNEENVNVIVVTYLLVNKFSQKGEH